MKNNILLILAVAIISVGIILATVLITTSGSEDESSADESSRTSVSDTQGTTDEPSEPQTTPAESEGSVPESSTPQTSVLDPESAPDRIHDSEAAEGIISTARSLIGIDFIDGGDDPETGFDNSGFIYYVLRENGYITCPRDLSSQAEMGTALTMEELHPGDLAYFLNEQGGPVGFGGIYCGDGMMIACLQPGTQVKEINITTPFYTGHFYRGVSLT